MKTVLAVVAACTVVLTTSLVVGQDRPATPALPPGIAAEAWIPLGDRAGFVVTTDVIHPEPDTLNGYFLARHADTWKRLDSEGGFRFQPLQK